MRIPAAKIYFPESDWDEILERTRDVLSSGWLTLGKYTKELEKKFSESHGISHAVATNSGTSSLEIAMRILNPEGGEVICPTNTFFATPAAVLHAGGSIRFVDIEQDYFSIDPERLQDAITSKTRLVVVVHIGGIISPRIVEIAKICQENDIILLEDAAHAHGCHLSGRFAGSFGQAGSFSLFATKVITSGEGGIIVTNDERIDSEARIYRDQGKAPLRGNYHVKLGYNWRLSEINAIVGISQLARMEEFIEGRQRIARIFDRELEDVSGVTRVSIPGEIHCNYYKYIAMLDADIDRNDLKKKLRENHEVSLSGEVYETPCHEQPIFEKLPGSRGKFPVATDFCSRHICLPIFPMMTDDEAMYVIESLKQEL
ncbi:MAG: DegT/DnrJ/EryC1/StrS family aminotransferase [Candidatus Thorarchaeota archaeon]